MASKQASVAGTSAGKLADTRAMRINVAWPASAAAAQRPVLHAGKVDALQQLVARPRRWSLAGSQVHSIDARLGVRACSVQPCVMA